MLIGRAHELFTVASAVERVAGGGSHVLSVVGEPGIGKTALLRAARLEAARAGMLVLSGRAAEHEHDVPFGLVVDALDDHVASVGARRLESLGADAELAAVFPALGAGAAVTAERFRYHRAVRALVDMLGRERPVALVLDDLHWADEASLELVLHLLHRPPRSPHLLVLATRPVGPAGRLLDGLRAAESADRIVLRRLSDAASRELLHDVPEPARERACREGAGNPLFLLEMARAAGDLAPTIVAVVEGELARMDEPARVLARGAAVAGDPFTPELAAASAGLGDGLAAFDALAASGLVVADGRRWSFRHPLVQRAVYESAPAGWRISAHARAAAALAGAGAAPVARAYHVEQSAQPGDEDAVAVLCAAAEASAPSAPATAAHWWRAALDLLPHGERRPALLRPLAKSLAAAGRLGEAHAVLLELDDGAPETAVALAGVERALGRFDAAFARLEAAMEAVGGEGAVRARLVVELAVTALYGGRPDHAPLALRAASLPADAPATLRAAGMAARGVSAARGGDLATGRAALLDGLALAAAASDDALAADLETVLHLGTACRALEVLTEVDALLARATAIARATRQEQLLGPLRTIHAAVRRDRGYVAECAAMCEESEDAARLLDQPRELYSALGRRVIACDFQGEPTLARRIAAECEQLAVTLPGDYVRDGRGAIALLDLQTDPSRCLGRLLEIGGAELERMEPSWSTWLLLAAVRAALASGNAAEAERLAGVLGTRAERLGLPLPRSRAACARAELALARREDPAEFGGAAPAPARDEDAARFGGAAPAPARDEDAARFGGAAPTPARDEDGVGIGGADRAPARGEDPAGFGGAARGDDAVAFARAAVEHAERAGAGLYATDARLVLGRALEGGEAREVLQRAWEDADRGGAGRLRAEAARLLRRLGHRPPAAAADELSARERELVALAAEGASNKQIAATLHLSAKTVEYHLSRAYVKLGVRSRVELAAAVIAAASPSPSRPAR